MALVIQKARTADPLLLKNTARRRVITILLAPASLLASLLLLLSTPDRALSMTPGDLYRQAKAATVLIVGINDESNALSFGSGVFISEQGLVLTNAHVVEDSTRLFVYIRNQAVDPAAQVLAIDSDLDVAALRVHTDRPAPFIPLAAEVPDEGTQAIAVGYPRVADVLQMGLTLHASVFPMTISGAAMGRSRTSGLPIPFVQTVGMLNAGSSGGPLVQSETGEIAGLVVHTVPYLEQIKNAGGERLGTVMMRAGLSYSIPVSRLRDWLQKNHIPFSAKQTEVPFAPRERSPQLVHFSPPHISFISWRRCCTRITISWISPFNIMNRPCNSTRRI